MFVRAVLSILFLPAVPAPWGPPAVCHPVAIGDAASLPWVEGAFGVDAGYDTARLVDDTLVLLAGSDEVFVHMETLRRATVYLTGIGREQRPASAWREAQTARLLAALDARVPTRVAEPAEPISQGVLMGGGGACLAAAASSQRGEALALFDAGYLRAALAQVGLPAAEDGSERLEQAVALAPDDGALRLGAAIAAFGQGRPGRTCYVHLQRALDLSGDRGSLLHRNLMATMGKMLGADTHEALAGKVRDRLERT